MHGVTYSVAPDWWLPCYDLSTEFHFFCGEYRRRCLEERNSGSSSSDSSRSSSGDISNNVHDAGKNNRSNNGDNNKIDNNDNNSDSSIMCKNDNKSTNECTHALTHSKWIVKPSQGSRSLGHRIITCE